MARNALPEITYSDPFLRPGVSKNYYAWQYHWSDGGPGRPRKKKRGSMISLKTTKLREAHAVIQRLEEEHLASLGSGATTSRSVDFPDAWEAYLKGKNQTRTRKACTVTNMRRMGEQLFKRWKFATVDMVTQEQVIKLLDDMKAHGNAPATLNRVLSTLSGFFKWCEQMGYRRGDSPTKGIQRAREPKHEVRWLTEDEEAKLLQACQEAYTITKTKKKSGKTWEETLTPPDYLYTMVLLGLRTGIRKATLEQFRWSWINWSRNTITLPPQHTKGGREWTVQMAKDLREALEQWREKSAAEGDSDLVFQGCSVWDKHLRKAGKRAGVDVSPHRLKSTFLSRLAQKGVPLKVVQSLGQHADITTTMRYVGESQQQMDSAIDEVFG